MAASPSWLTLSWTKSSSLRMTRLSFRACLVVFGISSYEVLGLTQRKASLW